MESLSPITSGASPSPSSCNTNENLGDVQHAKAEDSALSRKKSSLEELCAADTTDECIGLALEHLSTFEERSAQLEWRLSATLASINELRDVEKRLDVLNDLFNEVSFLLAQNIRLYSGGDTIGNKTLQVRVSRCATLARSFCALTKRIGDDVTLMHDKDIKYYIGVQQYTKELCDRINATVNQQKAKIERVSCPLNVGMMRKEMKQAEKEMRVQRFNNTKKAVVKAVLKRFRSVN